MTNPVTPIFTGQIDSPYQEFVYTIPASETLVIDYDFDYFRLLSYSGTGLQVRFGGSGTFTNYTAAGIGFKLPQAINRVDLKNTSGAAITITVALAIGVISDDRTILAGAVTTVNGDTFTSPNWVTVANTATVLSASNSDKTLVEIYNPDSTNSFYIGDSGVDGTTNGTVVPPEGRVWYSVSGAVYGIDPSNNGIQAQIIEVSK